MTPPKGRAATPEAKREIVERLLAAWEKAPQLRLGQLIVAATQGRRLFHVEDEALAEALEAFVQPRNPSP